MGPRCSSDPKTKIRIDDKPLVHLRAQVRDALPPLHNVSPDGRTAHAGEHVLALCVARFSDLTSLFSHWLKD
jgi:hypothetical protein